MKKAPPSPLLMRLDAHIKAEKDAFQAGCLKAERAGLFGRLGFFDEARAAIDALQKEFAGRPNARVSAWMQIAEGWLSFYQEDYDVARDHFARAKALSDAFGDTRLIALSATWLANIAYLNDDFEEMGRCLEIGTKAASPGDHLTRPRLSMVVAMACFFADLYEAANSWSIRARNHAAALNDESMLSALNFNMTIRRVYYLAELSVRGLALDSTETMARIGIESTHVFDRLLGISLVGNWNHPFEAQLNSACQRYKEAIAVYEVHIRTLPRNLEISKAMFLADNAWCYANVGQAERAVDVAHEAEGALRADMSLQDRCLALGRLRQLFEKVGEHKLADRYAHLETDSNAALQSLRERALLALASFS